ncbi:MAG TPA: hypothetical protein VHU15_06830 [Stellaceae bacterium]|jgi:hypothetical protein|nr:hypothetical protein [Stellaceae bacterium]
MSVITRLFDNYSDAARAVSELERAGIPADDISIVANNSDGWYRDNNLADVRRDPDGGRVIDRDHDGVDDRTEGAGAGAGIGATIGGVAGLLAGLGLLAIPGIGPVVAAGWLASTAALAAAGGVTGGIIGALTQAGVSEEEAHAYAEGVRRGGTLVTARVPDGERNRYEAILDRAAVNMRERTAFYQKTGWSRFNPNDRPYTVDEITRERELY